MSYRSRSEREMVAWARARGWRVLGRNQSGHLELEHTSGAFNRIPGKCDSGRMMRNVRRQLLGSVDKLASIGGS